MGAQNKKAVIPVWVTALARPVVLPSSKPRSSGKDSMIDNQYDSYDDGQIDILMGICSVFRTR
jgi:hypothetical protein